LYAFKASSEDCSENKRETVRDYKKGRRWLTLQNKIPREIAMKVVEQGSSSGIGRGFTEKNVEGSHLGWNLEYSDIYDIYNPEVSYLLLTN
jgi:hypothetical protein